LLLLLFVLTLLPPSIIAFSLRVQAVLTMAQLLLQDARGALTIRLTVCIFQAETLPTLALLLSPLLQPSLAVRVPR
jgi:hypothetical protein